VLGLLGKLAVGDNHQVVAADGSTTVTVPGQAPVVSPGGLLALSSNSGHFSRDRVSLVPEFGVNLGYQVTPHLRVFTGYTLLYWFDVVRAGDQVDLTVNPNLLPPVTGAVAGPPRPAPRFQTTDLWVQGLLDRLVGVAAVGTLADEEVARRDRAGDAAGGPPEGDRRLVGRPLLPVHTAIVPRGPVPPSPSGAYSMGAGAPTTPTRRPETYRTLAMPAENTHSLPPVLADLPLSPVVTEMLNGRVELLPWEAAQGAEAGRVQAVYTYGHPVVGASLLGRMPGVRVISNFGVGVDHIDLAAAAARGIPVGNTPGILNEIHGLPGSPALTRSTGSLGPRGRRRASRG
jgi:hypothetical protein